MQAAKAIGRFLDHIGDGMLDKLSVGKRKTTNVVLIGATGAGKSTFGNYLYNFGAGDRLVKEFPGVVRASSSSGDVGVRGSVFDMAPPGSTKPCTARVSSASWEFEPGHVMNLIDTPGLGELDVVDDMDHMFDLLETLHALGTINFVVFLEPYSTKYTHEYNANLLYYKKIFEPVLRSYQLVYIVSHFTDEKYIASCDPYEAECCGRTPKTRAELKEEAVKRCLDVWKMQPATVELMDLAPRQLHLRRMLSKLSAAAHDGLMPDFDDTMLYHSWLSRQKLLSLFKSSASVSLKELYFALPPVIEDVRVWKIDALQQRIDQSHSTMGVLQNARESHMRTLHSLSSKREQVERTIRELDANIAELQGNQYTAPQSAVGDDIVNILEKHTKTLTMFCPIGHYTPLVQTHNAEWIDETKVEENAGATTMWRITGKATPDKINFQRATVRDTDGNAVSGARQRWFVHVKLEYAGHLANAAEIGVLREKRAAKVEEVRELRDEHDEKEAEMLSADQESAQLIDEQKLMEKHKRFFSRELYTLKEVAELKTAIIEAYEQHRSMVKVASKSTRRRSTRRLSIGQARQDRHQQELVAASSSFASSSSGKKRRRRRLPKGKKK